MPKVVPSLTSVSWHGENQRSVACGDNSVFVLDRERPGLAVESPGIVATLGKLGTE